MVQGLILNLGLKTMWLTNSFLLFFTVFLFYYHLAINVYADFWIISRACIHAHTTHTHTHTPHFSHLALGVGIPIVLV